MNHPILKFCLLFTVLLSCLPHVSGQKIGGRTLYGNFNFPSNCTDNSATIVINEVGNQSDNDFGPNAGEYIELLVLGDYPGASIDVSGFVIDDSHFDYSPSSWTDGHIVLGNCFSNVFPGAVILLYDDNRVYPGIDPSNDGAPNAEGIYQIPFSSSCLQKLSSCPSSSDPTYCTDGSPYGISQDWKDYLNLNDTKEVVQVRNPAGGLEHALAWGHTGNPVSDLDITKTVYLSGDLSSKVLSLAVGDHTSPNSYQLSTINSSPGGANTGNNSRFIEGVSSTSCMGDTVTIGCQDLALDKCYNWSPAQWAVGTSDGQAVVFPPMDTVFVRTTINDNGDIEEVRTYRVKMGAPFEVSIAESLAGNFSCGDTGESVDVIATVTGGNAGYTFLWSNGDTGVSTTVQPGELVSVTVTSPDGCQQSKGYYNDGVSSGNMAEIDITAPQTGICQGETTRLSAIITNADTSHTWSYIWNTGGQNSYLDVTNPGVYSVSALSSMGCLLQDTFHLSNMAPEFSISSSSLSACALSPTILNVEIDNPQGLSYQWSTGNITRNITVSSGGMYSVTVTNNYCSTTRSFDVTDGVRASIESSSSQMYPAGGVTLSGVTSGGQSPFEYQWSTGSLQATTTVSQAGIYEVTISDKGGCSDQASIEIFPYEPANCDEFSVAISFLPPTCETDGLAVLSPVISGEYRVASYQWSTGANTEQLGIPHGGQTITLTVSSDNGCVTQRSVDVPDFDPIDPQPASDSLCQLVDYLSIISLAEDQGILVFEGLSELRLNDLLAQEPSYNVEVRASYQTRNGPVTATTPVSNAGASVDPATWAGELTGLISGTDISLSIHLSSDNACHATCTQERVVPYLEVRDSVEVVVEENPEIILENYECGDTLSPDSLVASTVPLTTLSVEELIQINGFPILIKSLLNTQSTSGTYSGEGLIPLPFNNRTIRVAFDGIVVNEHHRVILGDIYAVADELTNYDFTMDTLMVGGEICVREPQEEPDYDENGINPVTGFDSTGVHPSTGQPYDEYGFYEDGTHVSGSGIYNPDGCSRDGRTENGGTCQPAIYQHPAALAYLDSIRNQLENLVNNAIQTVIDEADGELTAQEAICNSIRGNLDSLITILNFDAEFIYGQDSLYYKSGLSTEFTTEPQVLQITPRDQRVVTLETAHVALYACDEEEQEKLAELTDLLSALALPVEVLDFIEERLSFLSPDEVASLSSTANLINWIEARVRDYADLRSSSGTTEAYPIAPLQPNLFLPPSQQFTGLATLAGGSEDILLADREELLLYELNSQFNQGFRVIQGVHRAHYLEKLVRLREQEQNEESSSNLLPITVTKIIGGLEYTILLDQIVFHAGGGSTLSAFLIIEDPESGQKLVFESLETGFGPGGVTEAATLQLANTVAIRLSNAARLILDKNNTFVDWDCEGFLGMGVAGKVELCRNFIVPLEDNSLVPLPEPELFHLSFETYVTEWFDAVIMVDAGPFAIANHENLKWQLDSIVIDLSDRITPDFIPLEGYSSIHYGPEGLSPLWRGFYMQNASATLPNDFGGGNSEVSVGVRDLLIDGTGFSGQAYVEGVEILSIEEGNAGGWPFSIDELNVKVLHNNFAGAGFGGQLLVPIFEDPLSYDAQIYSDNRFKFTVQPDTTLRMDMMLAEVNLEPCSKIEIGYDYDGFLAVATLTGDMRFEIPSDASVDLELPELGFQEFRVSNRDPYFDAGTWIVQGGVNLNLKFGGFDMDISNIMPYKGNTTEEAGLGFDLAINLSEADAFHAEGRFGIMGELEEINQRQKWKFKEIDLQGLYINTTIKDVVKVEGSLQWFKDDPNYGKGFHGILAAEFTTSPLDFSAQVAGQFGEKDGTKYFFVDALADLGAGAGTGVLNVNGFGGGISRHMNNDFGAGTPAAGLPAVGESFSGAVYTVDPTIGLGLKGVAMISTAQKELFNGWVGLEFLFNSNSSGGGLREINLKGQGQFLADIIPEPPGFVEDIVAEVEEFIPPVDDPPTISADGQVPISAWVDLGYNFNERVFDGKLEAYLNVGNILTGAGANDHLVQAAIHVSSEKWYINIGTPSSPAGMKVNLPIFKAGGTAYFNVGNDIPDFPGLPSNVASITNLVGTNESLRKSGGGIMFGANLYAEARLRAGPIQGFLDANIGFDLMLRNYGDAVCAGSNEPVGINGWYAAGQAWAYLNGGVKLFGAPIFEAGIAGVLQARLPNPVWAQATMAAKVKLLFIQKKVNFKVSIGELCDIVDPDGNAVDNQPIISYITPMDQAEEVAVDEQPEIYFLMPVGKTFRQGGDTYRVSDPEITLNSLSRGYPLAFSESWLSSDRTALRLIPTRFFPGNDSIRLDITVTVTKNGAPYGTEEKSIVFTTAGGYDYVPATNVAYSYPVSGMYDFHPSEYAAQQGFIKLVASQYELFDGTDLALVLHTSPDEEVELDFTYDDIKREIIFDLPASHFTAENVYGIGMYDRGDGNRTVLEPFFFRASPYVTFSEKLLDWQNAPPGFGIREANVPFISKQLAGNLRLGEIAHYGGDLPKPMVRFQASVSSFYQRQLDREIYDYLPMSLNTSGCATPTIEGVGQFNSISEAAGVKQYAVGQPLEISSGDFLTPFVAPDYSQVLQYAVPSEAYRHFQALREQIGACVDLITQEFTGEPGQGNQTLDQEIRQLLGESAYRFYQNVDFPNTPAGYYQINVGYHLPNNVRTSRGTVNIHYDPNNGGGGQF